MKVTSSDSMNDSTSEWKVRLAHLSAIIEFSDDAIISKSLDGTITSWNPGAEKMFGYSSSEIIGQSVKILFPKENLQEEDEIISRLVKGERVPHFETIRIRKNGHRLHVSATISPIKDDQGNIIGASKILRDITDQKHAIAKFNRATDQIAEQAALLDKAHDAILLRGLNGEVLFWNTGAEKLYGWSRQEAVGRKVSELIYKDSTQFNEFNAIVINKGEWSGELVQNTRDGRLVNIEASWSLLRDKDGRPKSVLAINTDVTERKKIEAQFMRAQRMESIGTLAGGIAHDLNNVLTPIMMSIDVLKLMVENPKAQNILKTIEVSTQRGADMVRQVLSFARGLEGRQIEVQTKHLLRDIEHIVKDAFPKDIKLKFSVPSDTWTILGDPTQLHQVLLNLCVNARDAMPDGGFLTICVENRLLDGQYLATNPLANAGPYVIISVTDSGMGIPKEIIDKIFDPFFTTKDIGKGTGLGLSTVMAIVKSHKGFLNVYSEPGKGTTFKVYLPAETSSSSSEEVPQPDTLPRGNEETILVIDDETSILSITCQTLEAFGYRILSARNGAEAVGIYAKHQRDIAVVITDMMMPIMDGPATIQALMTINPAVKVIAVSGLNANGNATKVAGIGVKHFLTKPYTAEILLKALRAIIEET